MGVCDRERFLLCPELPPPLLLWRPETLESLLPWWLAFGLRWGSSGEGWCRRGDGLWEREREL